MVRILVVEDEPRMRALVRRGLAEQGHVVESAATGPDAIDVAGSAEFDVLVVDVMLPGCDGVAVVRQLRSVGNRTPALMLTARDATADIVAALDGGADDYLIKPFSFAVLLARVRALGRRGPIAQGVLLQVAELALETTTRSVTRAGRPVHLTRTEHSLLETLMRRAGRVVTRQALIDAAWGAEREVESNTLDAFVKSLRQKIETGAGRRLIHTVRGIGYSMRVEPES